MVLHGRSAVAELKLPILALYDFVCGVLHGRSAVAELKPGARARGAVADRHVLHGRSAVAELKRCKAPRYSPRSESSPRPISRGRIEAISARRSCVASRRSPRPISRGRIEAKTLQDLQEARQEFSTA